MRSYALFTTRLIAVLFIAACVLTSCAGRGVARRDNASEKQTVIAVTENHAENADLVAEEKLPELSFKGYLLDIIPDPNMLGREAKDFVSLENLLLLGIGVGGAIAIDNQDDDIAEWFADERPLKDATGPADVIGRYDVLSGFALALHGVGYANRDEKLTNTSKAMVDALIYDMTAVGILKLAVDRDRPNGRNEHSFPSGHASGSFTVAAVLDEMYGWKAGVPAYMAATYVSLSRIEDREHRASEVFAGAALGFIIGKSVAKTWKNKPANLDIVPIVDLETGDTGLALEYRF